jgi:hypothetical protein
MRTIEVTATPRVVLTSPSPLFEVYQRRRPLIYVDALGVALMLGMDVLGGPGCF